MPIYEVDGRRANVIDDKVDKFLSVYPSAKLVDDTPYYLSSERAGKGEASVGKERPQQEPHQSPQQEKSIQINIPKIGIPRTESVRGTMFEGKTLVDSAKERIGNMPVSANAMFDMSVERYKQQKDWINEMQKDSSVSPEVKKALMDDYVANVRTNNTTVDDKNLPPAAKEWLERNEVDVVKQRWIPKDYMTGDAGHWEEYTERGNTPEQIETIKDHIANSAEGQAYAQAHKDFINGLEKEIDPLLSRIDSMRETSKKNKEEYAQKHNISAWTLKNTNAQENALINKASQLLKNTKLLLSSNREGNGFWKGFHLTNEDLRELVALTEGFYNDKTLNQVIDKYQEAPDSLNEAEKIVIQAKYIADQINAGVDPGSWYNIGQSTKQSLPFMRDFILTAPFGGAAANLVKGGLSKVAGKATEKLLSKGVGRVARNIVKGAIDLSVRPAVQTMFSPSSYSMAYQEMAGMAVGEDENGDIIFDNRKTFKHGATSAFIENQSEVLGEVVLDKLFQKLHIPLPAFMKTNAAKRLSSLTGIQNPMAEYAEEKYADLANIVRGEQTIEGFFDPRQNLETFGAVAIMQIPFSAINSTGYGIGKIRDVQAKRAIKQAFDKSSNNLNEYFGEDAEQVVLAFNNLVDNSTEDEIRHELVSVIEDERLDDNSKRAIVEYITSYSAYSGINRAKKEQVQQVQEETAQLVQENSNPQMEAVMSAAIGGYDSPMQVVGGNIIQNEDGSINREFSDQSVTIVDAEGKRIPVSIKFVESISESIPTQEAIEQAGQMAIEPIIAQQENEEVRPYEVGEVATTDVYGNGITFTGEIADITEDGRYMIVDVQSGQQVTVEPRQIINQDNVQGVEDGSLIEYRNEKGEVVQGIVGSMAALRPQGMIALENGEAIPIDNVIGLAQSIEKQVPDGIQDMDSNDIVSENAGGNEMSAPNEYNKVSEPVERKLTPEESDAVISMMENDAAPAPEMDLTPENWVAEFGEDGMVDTPIGQVKMGENQLAKMFLKKRDAEFGMIKPTLNEPDIVIEEQSEATGGNTERGSSYLFIKTFVRDGKKIKYFTSVTISKDGMEVVISNHISNKKAIGKKISENKVVYNRKGLLSANDSDLHLVESHNGQPDLLPTQTDNNPSIRKDKDNNAEKQTEVANSAIPLDEKGNPMYHRVPVDITVADLNDGSLTPEEVDGFISANKDEAVKLLKRVSEKPPKIGTNKAKYLVDKQTWQAKMADAQVQADYWNEVEKYIQAIRQHPGDTAAADILAMGEPLNGNELAAQLLGTGKLPLLYGDYKRETGFNDSEAKGMFGLFATKENGGMTIEQAGEQLMLADLEDGTNFLDQNDPNAGRNAIIDVLSSVRTRGGLTDYIKNSREVMAERERRAEVEADEQAREQWYQDNYHMTPEEYELWNQGELFAESNMISDEDYQEFMSNFADKILKEQENDGRTSQESGSSIAESESNEQGGISGVRESGGTVLQGEESVSAGTTGRIEEESSQIDANSGAEHDTLQSRSSRRELISSSHSQENVPETYIPSKMEGESLLDYASRVNDAYALHQEEQNVDTNPTEAQKEAGNYKKGHIKVDGFDITIENPRGSERSGVDADGKPWSVTMNNTYGYIRGTEGIDGDHIDVFLGNSGSGVYVIDQVDEDGSFDEHKVMYGFDSMDEAKEAYLSNYSPGWKGLGNITGVSKEVFKDWIDSSHRKTKPFAEYKIAQNKKPWQITAKEYTYSVGSPKMEIEIDSGVSFHQLSKMSKSAKNARIKQRIEERNTANTKYKLAVKEWENKVWDAYLNGEFSANDVYDTEAFYVLSERINDLGVDLDSPFKISKRNPKERETYLKRIDSALSEKKLRVERKKDSENNNTRLRTGENYISEEQLINNQAKADGTYLKAPNGEDTNLSPQQWVQVRTKAFKEWFGNWENEPENSSKVVDENGEPLVMYHGTSAGGFSIFNTYGSNFGLFGQGSYFTDDRTVAESYTEKGKGGNKQVYGVFLNIHRPLDMNSRNIVEGWKAALPDDIQVEIGEDSTNESVYRSVLESFEYNEYPRSEAQEILYDLPVTLGYDGVTHVGGGKYDKKDNTKHRVWIAMEPTQIKSATENSGEYSGENGDIRFREVFHGSPYDFDRFDHSFMGSGEGVQAFGWGTYVTEVNGIAKSYAETLASRSQVKRINELARNVQAKKDFIKARKQAIKKNEDYERYARSIQKNLKGLQSELKSAQKIGNEKDMRFYQGLVEVVEQQLDIDYHKNLINSFWDDVNDAQSDINEMEKQAADLRQQIKELKGKRNLYTVETPDNNGVNYLSWNEPLTDIQKRMIAEQAEKEGYGDSQISYRDDSGNLILNTSGDVTGESLYKELGKGFLLGSDNAASEFLHRAGFVGIEYPAQAMSGGRVDNAKNYVIFNENDLEIKNHTRFRSVSENGTEDRTGTMKTYHGSGAAFDRFDTSHMGEGQGEAMIGKGVYTSKSKKVARNYVDVAKNRTEDGKGHLYEVRIPIDNGSNYLDYDKLYDAKEMAGISARLRDSGVDIGDVFDRYFQGGVANGRDIYRVLSWNTPEDKDVNQVLNDAGYIGYRYSTRHDLSGKNKLFQEKSYVVFNPNNASIVNHEQIVSRLEKTSSTLNAPVRVVRNVEELSDGTVKRAIEKGRRIKGWYDVHSGEVVVYLPNADSADDAVRTVLHEVVGHRGLRLLFGEEKYDRMMMKLYGQLPEEVRQSIKDVAERDYKADIAVAMDEYLAEQAEQNEIPSWWNRVVSVIRDFLRNMGLNVNLSANDVKYLLWRSRKNLGNSNLLSMAEDVAMRYKLGVGEYSPEENDSRYDKAVQAQNDFTSRYNSADILVIKNVDILARQMEAIGITDKEQLQNIEEIASDGVTSAVFLPDYDRILIFVENGSEDYESSLFHENFHRAINKFKLTEEEINRLFNIVYPVKKEKYDKVLDIYRNIGESELAAKEECVVYSLEAGVYQGFDKFFGASTEDPTITKILDFIGYEKTKERGRGLLRQELGTDATLRNNEVSDGYAEEGGKGRNDVGRVREEDARENFRFRETNEGQGRSTLLNTSDLDNIRFRSVNDLVNATNSTMTEDVRNQLDKKLKLFHNKLREQWEDRHLPVKVFLDVLRENGTEVAEYNDYYKQVTHINGKIDAQLEHYNEKFQRPLNKAISNLEKAGFDYRSIENYAILKHGIERNEWMRQDAINQYKLDNQEATQEQIDKFSEKLPDDYSGITAVQEEVGMSAGDFISDFENKAGNELIDDFWSKIKAATSFSLQKQKEGGLIDKKTLNELSSRYEYYIPLRGHDAEVAEDRWDYSPNMGTYFVAPLIKAKGRKTRSESPFAYIFSMAQSSINSTNRNLLNQTILRLANKDKTKLLGVNKAWYVQNGLNEDGKPVYEVQSPVYSENHEQYERNIEEFEERMQKLAEAGLAVQSGNKLDIGGLFIKRDQAEQHEAHVYQNGTEYVVYINANPAVARAITGANAKDLHKDLRFIARVSRQMAANFTTRNPIFVLSNFSRDYIFASSILPVKEDAKYTVQFQRNMLKSAGALQRYIRGRADLTKIQDRYLVEYIMNGAKTGFSHIIELQKIQKQIEREIKKGDNKSIFRHTLDALESCNEFAENLSRLSVYITSREQGRSIVQSVSDAKEVTVNFNRNGAGGWGAAWFRSLYLFVNAGIQSLSNFAKVAQKNKGKTTLLISSYTLSGFLMPLLSALIGGDDGAEEYMKLSDWERQSNLCIYTGNGFIKIPLPHELRVFHAMGDNVYQVLFGKKDITESILDVLLGFSDLIPANPTGAVHGSWADIMPDATKPFFQLAANKNFTGSMITNEWADPNKPGYLRIRTNKKGEPYAPAFLVKLGESLDSTTGGDGVEKGWFSFNPDEVNHILRGYFGGLYSMGMQVLDLSSKVYDIAETGEFKLKSRETPLKAFYTSSDDLLVTSSGLNSKYFKISDDIRETERKIKGYQQQVSKGEIGIDKFAEKIQGIAKDVTRYERVYPYIKRIKKLESVLKELDSAQQKEVETIISNLKKEVIEINSIMDK